MSVKSSLEKFFNQLLEYWKNEYGMLPKVPWEEDLNPMLYIGEPDEEEYISWMPRVKDRIYDFSKIEEVIGIKIHDSIKEYFNSFWFLNLQGFLQRRLVILEPVEPEKDITQYFVNLKEYEENRGEILKYIHIGFISPEDLPLLVDNMTGQVISEDYETGEKQIVANSIEELVKELNLFKK